MFKQILNSGKHISFVNYFIATFMLKEMVHFSCWIYFKKKNNHENLDIYFYKRQPIFGNVIRFLMKDSHK